MALECYNYNELVYDYDCNYTDFGLHIDGHYRLQSQHEALGRAAKSDLGIRCQLERMCGLKECMLLS